MFECISYVIHCVRCSECKENESLRGSQWEGQSRCVITPLPFRMIKAIWKNVNN